VIRRNNRGRFLGFRVNCENVPLLPAGLVRQVWDDPRGIPYLLLWIGERDGLLKEAVRVIRRSSVHEPDWIEIKRRAGSTVAVYPEWQTLPSGGGRSLLLSCWSCRRQCRALYGYKKGDDGRYYVVRQADWLCRRCAALRYTSEGGYLRPGMMFRAFGNLPRPELWFPYVFTDLEYAAAMFPAAFTRKNLDEANR
jgi:hypothetical protein